MESILTPIVGRLLSRFVKSAAGTDGSDLRASLKGGNVSLHNLEINLDSILHSLPVAVERAFAKQLTVSIPWTSLTSQPIQITLDTVEVVLSGSPQGPLGGNDGTPTSNDSADIAAEGSKDTNDSFLGGAWMGPLANLLMRTLLNVTIKVNNIVVKCVAPTTLATLTCKSVCVRTAENLQLDDGQNPRSWLKKDARITRLALSLESLTSEGQFSSQPLPLIVSAGAHVSAQFPVFAVLEKQDEGVDEGQVAIDVDSTTVAISESQLSLLTAFISSLPKTAAHPERSQAQHVHEPGAEPQVSQAAFTFSPRKAKGKRDIERRRRAAEAIFRSDRGSATSGVSSVAAGAMGAVGAVWSFIANDAAAEDAQMASEEPPVPQISKSDIRVALTCTLAGGTVLLLHDPVDGAKQIADRLLGPRNLYARGQERATEVTPAAATTPPPLRVRTEARAVQSHSFLEELEEAAASPPLTPATSLPTSPEPYRVAQQDGEQAMLGEVPRLGSLLTSRFASAATFLSMDFVLLQVSLAVAEEQLISLDACIHSCSIIRVVDPGDTPSGRDVQDEVLGLHPLDGIESSTLTSPEGRSLALRLCWQLDRDPLALVPHATSIHVGHVFAAHVPGLSTTLLQFFSGVLPAMTSNSAATINDNMPGTHAQTGGAAFEAGGSAQEAMASNAEHRLAPPAWLMGGAVFGCSVMSLQLAALSAASLQAEAAALSVQHCSVHLGALRPTARPGSLAAELLSLQKQALPGEGLRMAAVGAQLGVAEHWKHAASRGESSEDALAGAGVQCISDGIEVQALMHVAQIPNDRGAGAPGTLHPGQIEPTASNIQTSASHRAATPASHSDSGIIDGQTWLAAAAVSPICVRMTSGGLAILTAVAEGVSAEVSRSFRGPFPVRAFLGDEEPALGAFGSSATAMLQTSRIQLLYAPIGAGHFMGTPQQAEADVQQALCLTCSSVSAALRVKEPLQPDGDRDSLPEAIVMNFAAVQPLLRAGPGVSLLVPSAEVSIGREPVTEAVGSQASPTAPICSPCGPPIILLCDIRLQRVLLPRSTGEQEPGQLSLSIQSISFALAMQQLALLVNWAITLFSVPLFPQLPSYLPAQLSGASSMSFKASFMTASGQLFTEDALPSDLGQLDGRAGGFVIGVLNSSLQLQATSSWASTADADALLHRTVQSVKHMQVLLGCVDVCTLCPDQTQDLKLFWTLRCQNPSIDQPAVIVSLRSKDTGSALDERSSEIALNVHTVEARVTPAVQKEMHALLLAVFSAVAARTSSSTGNKSQLGSKQSEPRRTSRLAVQSVTLEAASDCVASHERPSCYASDLPNAAISAVASAEDVVVVLFSAGEQRIRDWPLPPVQSTQVDVGVVSAAARLFGPGLPFRGAPLLLPVDIHVSLTRKCSSLLLDMSALCLMLQISFPVLLAASILADCFRPVQSKAESPTTLSGASQGYAPKACDEGPLVDDLRCGLFEPAEDLAARPGRLQISCGDQAAGSGIRSQAARSWVSWRYPYPRQVDRILLDAGQEGLTGVSLQLSRVLEGSGERVTVPVAVDEWAGRLTADAAAAPQTHWLLIVQGDAPAAEEWKLCWEGTPTDGPWLKATAMLRSLYINPAGSGLPTVQQPLPTLVPVPLTIALSTDQAFLGFCLDDAAATGTASSLLQDSNVLADVRDLQVAVSLWPAASAVQLHGSPQVSYADCSTLSQELLVKRFRMAVAVEVAKHLKTPDADLCMALDPLPLPKSASSEPLDASPLRGKPPPRNAGVCIRMRVDDGPVAVRLSEVGMHQLCRLLSSAAEGVARLKAGMQQGLTPADIGGQQSALDEAGSVDDVRAGGILTGSARTACMLLKNCCPLDLYFGQVGTDERVALPSRASFAYTWASPPGLDPEAQRMLHVSTAALGSPNRAQPWEREPPHESIGGGPPKQPAGHAGDSLQMAETAEEDVEVAHESEAFDCMAEGVKLLSLPAKGGVHVFLSAQTTKIGAVWQTVLQPSHALVNRAAAPIQLCIVNSPSQTTPSIAPFQLEPQQDQLGMEHLVMVSYASSEDNKRSANSQTSLKVWLGRGNGWSLALPLAHLSPEVLPLQAGGLGAIGPELPPKNCANPPASLFCQLKEYDADCGHVQVVFWPPLLLQNRLSCCLHWRILAEDDAERDCPAVHEAALLPGNEVPLAVATEGGERLAVCLSGSDRTGEASTVPTEDWSEPLLFTGLAKDESAQSQGGYSTQAILPQAGQFRSVELSNGQGRIVLLLLAEPVVQGHPMLRLAVLPQVELHNTMQLPLSFEVPGCPAVTVDAHSHMASSWPMGQRPAQLVLSQISSTFSEPQGRQDNSLQSAPLEVEDGMQRLISLRSGDAGACQQVHYVSAAVHVTQHGNLTPVGTFNGPCESTYIHVSPGLIVSNLTPWPLYVMPNTCEANSRPTAIAPGSMQPLLETWQGASVQQHALLVSLLDSISADRTPPEQHGSDSQAASGKTAGQASFTDSFVRFLEEANGTEQKQLAAPEALPETAGTDSSQHSLSLFHSKGGRFRFCLANQQGQDILLACRVLSSHGRLHFVIFVDPQPPVKISNNSHADVEVGISQPGTTKDGNVVFTEPQSIMHIAADTSLECELTSSLQASAENQSNGTSHHASAEDGEEEEDFLESVTGQQSSGDSGAVSAPLLRVRGAGKEAWESSFALFPSASVLAGWLNISVWQQGATVHVQLADAHDTPEHSCSSGSPAGEGEGAAGGQQQRLQLHVELPCLQVSVWDDERGRLMGATAAEMGYIKHRRPGASAALCLSIDDLSLQLLRTALTGVSRGATTQTNATLTAGAMQCDSYLPGSSHPVILSSEPLRKEGLRMVANASFYLNLQLTQACGGSSRAARSLQDTWVRCLQLQLPAIALAVDDAQLALAERAAALFSRTRSADSRVILSSSQPVIDPGGSRNCGGSRAQLSGMLPWKDELKREAQIAAAPRLLIEELDIGALHFLVDIHVAGTSQRIPYPIDTHRAPVALSALRGRRLLFRPGVALQGALAHYTAEALLCAPGVLGSLELLLNPMGLLSSVSAGLADLLGLPLAALMAGSPAQFVASLGRGPASLLWHVSGWTLTSISGFSTAASHVLKRSLAAPPTKQAPDGFAQNASNNLQDRSGSGRAVSRGLLGAVGLPITGALDLVSGVTAGIASSTGVSRPVSVRRASWLAGEEECSVASPALCRRLLRTLPELAEAGSYRLHCSAADATLLEEGKGAVLAALAVDRPLLLFTDFALVVLAAGGLRMTALLRLEGAVMQLVGRQHRLQMSAVSSHCPALHSSSAQRCSLQLRLQASIPDSNGHALAKALQMHLASMQTSL